MQHAFAAFFYGLGQSFAKAKAELKIGYYKALCGFLSEWRDSLYRKHLAPTESVPVPVAVSAPAPDVIIAPRPIPITAPKPVAVKSPPRVQKTPIVSPDHVIGHHIMPRTRVNSDLKGKFFPSNAKYVIAKHTMKTEELYHSMFNTCIPNEVMIRIFRYYGFLESCTPLQNMHAICESMYGSKIIFVQKCYCYFTPNEKKNFERFMAKKKPGEILDFLFDEVWHINGACLTKNQKLLIEDARKKLNATS